MKPEDLFNLDELNQQDIFDKKIKPLLVEIENICEENRIPMIFAIQTSPVNIIESHMLYPTKTDERLFTCKTILEKGDLGFTNIYTKSAEDFKKLNDGFNQILTELLSDLIEHDSQFGKSGQPAETCQTDFGLLRAKIKSILKKQHLPTG